MRCIYLDVHLQPMSSRHGSTDAHPPPAQKAGGLGGGGAVVPGGAAKPVFNPGVFCNLNLTWHTSLVCSLPVMNKSLGLDWVKSRPHLLINIVRFCPVAPTAEDSSEHLFCPGPPVRADLLHRRGCAAPPAPPSPTHLERPSCVLNLCLPFFDCGSLAADTVLAQACTCSVGRTTT